MYYIFIIEKIVTIIFEYPWRNPRAELFWQISALAMHNIWRGTLQTELVLKVLETLRLLSLPKVWWGCFKGRSWLFLQWIHAVTSVYWHSRRKLFVAAHKNQSGKPIKVALLSLPKVESVLVLWGINAVHNWLYIPQGSCTVNKGTFIQRAHDTLSTFHIYLSIPKCLGTPAFTLLTKTTYIIVKQMITLLDIVTPEYETFWKKENGKKIIVSQYPFPPQSWNSWRTKYRNHTACMSQ